MRGRGKRLTAAKPGKSPPEAIKCAVCGVGDGKYKCPKCRMPFCCVQCSKDHKAIQCPALNENAAKADAAAASKSGDAIAKETSEYLSQKELKTDIKPQRKRPRRTSGEESDGSGDDPGMNITNEMKERLRRSSWLHKELQDGGLRQLIDQIDGASDDEEESDRNRRQHQGKKGGVHVSPRELALARTKHAKPKFASFVDRMLLTAGVLQPATGGGEGTGDGSIMDMLEGPGPLVLAPVPRRSGAADGDVPAESDEGSSNGSGDSSDSDSSDSSGDGEGSSGSDSGEQ